MTPELEALTFLLLLRHAAVPNPPRVSRWQSVSCDELSDLHFVYAEAIHGELSAVRTLFGPEKVFTIGRVFGTVFRLSRACGIHTYEETVFCPQVCWQPLTAFTVVFGRQ